MLWKKNRHVKNGGDIHIHDLLYATYSRDLGKIDELMQIGINPCSLTEDGTSPIHIASVMESPYGANIVFRMLSYGADPDVRTSTGLTPLHIAAMWGRVQTINVLLENGAEVSLKDYDDMSALDYCETAEENRYECIDALTRFRTPMKHKRRSRNDCFLAKSRLNLNKIMGDKVSFYEDYENSYNSRNMRSEEITKFSEFSNSSSFSSFSKPKPADAVYMAKQTDLIGKSVSSMYIDAPDGVTPNETVYVTAEESILTEDKFANVAREVISSTMLEGATMYDSAVSLHLSGETTDSSNFSDTSSSGSGSNLPRREPEIRKISSPRYSSSSGQFNSSNSELAVVRSTTELAKVRPSMDGRLCKSDEHNINIKKNVVVTPGKRRSKVMVPISFPTCASKNCQVNVNICIADNRKPGSTSSESSDACNRTYNIKDRPVLNHAASDNVPPHVPEELIPEPPEGLNEAYAAPKLDNQIFDFMYPHIFGDNRTRTESSVFSEYTHAQSRTTNSCKDASTQNGCPPGFEKPETSHPPVSENNKVIQSECTKLKSRTSNGCRDATTQSKNPPVSEKHIKIHSPASEKHKTIQHRSPTLRTGENHEDQKLNVKASSSCEALDATFHTARTISDHDYLSTTSGESYPYNKSVSVRVDEYEEKYLTHSEISYEPHSTENFEALEPEKYLSHSGISYDPQKFEALDDRLSLSSGVDECDCPPVTVPFVEFLKPRSIIEDLSDLPFEYNWKDVSRLANISIYADTVVKIPTKILKVHDDELRSKLKHLGVEAGKITDTTRRIYQKYLAKSELNHYLPLKPTDKYEDFTQEMAQILFGTLDLTEDTMDMLENEMTLKFTHPEKHTWREGTMNTSFNYLLLDPRVTNNLPERAKNLSYIEKFRIFVGALFHIGKGKKCRPYEYLHEASRFVHRPASHKINMIQEIWEAGHGVICVHVFHGIIPVEAFTREACMVEAMGLTRVTNSKHGDIYGTAVAWNDKKRRLLGIYMLMKAMDIYLMEGEKQIRVEDL